jgi:hypothetical protein
LIASSRDDLISLRLYGLIVTVGRASVARDVDVRLEVEGVDGIRGDSSCCFLGAILSDIV